MSLRPRAGLAAVLSFVALGDPVSATDPSAPAAPPSRRLAVGAGAVQIFDPDTRGFYSVNWQYHRGAHRVSYYAGAEATSRDLFVGGGAFVDLPIGARFILAPSFGAAWYHEDDGLGLGASLEFRSALEASWPLGRGRIGATFLHYSNAGTEDTNPGTEALFVVWTLPLTRRR